MPFLIVVTVTGRNYTMVRFPFYLELFVNVSAIVQPKTRPQRLLKPSTVSVACF